MQDAVLSLLSEDPEGLPPKQISKTLGIGEYTDAHFDHPDRLRTSPSCKLKKEGRVERSLDGRWQL